MLPGFSASSSLYHSRQVYAGHSAPPAGGIASAPASTVALAAYLVPHYATAVPYLPWPHVFKCPPALTACGWEFNTKWLKIPKCVDTSSDPNNCGGCGSAYACTPGEQCIGSECKCGGSNCCPPGYLYCDNVDNCCSGGEGTNPFSGSGLESPCPSGFGCCPLDFPQNNNSTGYCYTNDGTKGPPIQCCQ